MIPKEVLAENLAYLSMVYGVSLKHLRKLDKWRAADGVLVNSVSLEQQGSGSNLGWFFLCGFSPGSPASLTGDSKLTVGVSMYG